MWRTDSIALIDLKICKTELFPLNKNIVFEMVRIEMGKDLCVNVTCLGSCNFLLSKAT